MLRMMTLAALAACWLAAPARAQVTGDPVTVDGGMISGAWRADAAVREWLGVPFAAPPVGALRWQPPQPVPAWSGVRPATAFAAQCMQKGRSHKSVYYEYAGTQPTSEDCLYLNVWSPAPERAHDLPVMVWIYGGGFQQGSAANPVFDGTELAHRGVVVVTVNYRLGIFGFFAHPDLTAESPQHAAGNYGLLDQVAALRWVRRNIGAFGGNPDNVTIFGQSAGGASVDLLMGSPLARGLFQHAIAESYGLDRTMRSRAEAEADGARFAAGLSANGIGALRDLPAERLLDANRQWWWPIVDGWFLTEDIYSVFRQGHEAPVPLLTGWNANEGATFPHATSHDAYLADLRRRFGDAADKLLAIYPAADDTTTAQASERLFGDMNLAWGSWASARLHAKNGYPAFVYFFDHPQPLFPGQAFDENPDGAPLGTFHSSEYPYLFGTLAPLTRAWTGTDRALARELRGYWVGFAAAGNPNGAGLPYWPEFNGSDERIMRLGDHTGPGPALGIGRLHALDALGPPRAAN